MHGFGCWFANHSNLIEVEGFQNLSGMTDAYMLFSGCGNLETIWATGFDASAIEDGYMGLYGCYRLVGGSGFVFGDRQSTSHVVSALSLGDEGVLTDPDADGREWFWGHLYSDGELVLTASEEADESCEALLSGRHCANASYTSLLSQPWRDCAEEILSVSLAEDMGDYSLVNMDYWFYGASACGEVSGLSNLCGVHEMEYAFANCDALAELDFRGFDPSALTYVGHAFSGCSSLATIWADAGWELPGTASGLATFYSCEALVGGNGTAYDSDNISYEYFRIDAEDEEGYLTAG